MPKRKIKEKADNIFCNNLIYYRKINRLTQQQVADYLAVSRTAYTKYETGASEPSFCILRKIVELYDIDFNKLLLPYNEQKQVPIIVKNVY